MNVRARRPLELKPGICAPRTWVPHDTLRPLRSPLELREMSARARLQNLASDSTTIHLAEG